MSKVSIGVAVVLLLLVPGFSWAQTCGDPDNSNSITVTDGVLALRAAAELASSCTVGTCDVDRSGAVTVTDGVLILRLAAGLPAQGACLTTPTNESARQAINNNPYRGIFGDLTKIPGSRSLDREHLADPVALNDSVPGTVSAAAQVGQGANCPVAGFQVLQACQRISTANSTALVSTIRFNQCTSATATGFIRQDGILRETIAGAAECILFTQSQLPIGQEILEERQDFTSEIFDASSDLTDRQTENVQQRITYLDVCQGPLGARFPSNRRRNLNGEIEIAIFGESDPILFKRTYAEVAFTRLYSSSCAMHTTTLEEGTIETSDQRFGETYTVGFSDLQYALTSQASGSTLRLTLEGSLESSCGSNPQTFTYRTLTAPTFDPGGDGCPRGGTFEISSSGTVLGRIDFLDKGAVTITGTGGLPTTYASCNDPALLLNCTP